MCRPRYHREMFPGEALTWTHSNRPCQERRHFESSPRILEHAATPLLPKLLCCSKEITHRSCAELKYHTYCARRKVPEQGAGCSFSHDQHDGKDPQAPSGAWKARLIPSFRAGHGDEPFGACIWSKHLRCRCPLMTSRATYEAVGTIDTVSAITTVCEVHGTGMSAPGASCCMLLHL